MKRGGQKGGWVWVGEGRGRTSSLGGWRLIALVTAGREEGEGGREGGGLGWRGRR